MKMRKVPIWTVRFQGNEYNVQARDVVSAAENAAVVFNTKALPSQQKNVTNATEVKHYLDVWIEVQE